MAVCSHKLFGYNLECTRRVGYGGLYAEMIFNGRMINDAKGFYPVAFDGLTGLGQCTERLHLISGKEYVWKIIAGNTVKVRFVTEYGELIFQGNGSEGCFVSKYHCQSIRMEIVSDGKISYVSLQPADTYHGCRRDVLDAIKQLRPATVRVPGGCFAEADFSWKEGLKPVWERAPIFSGLYILFGTNEGYDGYVLNVDDYAAVCRYLDAEMEYTVGLKHGDPLEAAALVEYCNGDGDTEYGALRIKRGYPQPYAVRTWYIGNELGFDVPAGEAARKNDAFFEKMKGADPSIRTVSATGNFVDWDEKFLKCAKRVEVCAQHHYMNGDNEAWDLDYVLTEVSEQLLDRLRKAHLQSDGRPIVLDEWNLRWGRFGDSASALYAAVIMTMLIRHAEELDLVGASYFALVNEGVIRVYPDHVRLAPDGEILKRMAEHAGGEIVPCEDETCVKTVHTEYEYISIYNTSSTEERKLTGICGDYEVISPDGVWVDIRPGKGELDSLPPASVAFVRRKIQK